jgi:hypothetical protein
MSTQQPTDNEKKFLEKEFTLTINEQELKIKGIFLDFFM